MAHFPDISSPLSPTGGSSSAVEYGHVKKRSNGGRLRNDSEEMLRHNPGSPTSPQQSDQPPTQDTKHDHNPDPTPTITPPAETTPERSETPGHRIPAGYVMLGDWQDLSLRDAAQAAAQMVAESSTLMAELRALGL